MHARHNPLFSIVIPTFNYARYLPRALDSVLSQGGDDYEIIVVDDGSRDHTSEVVKAYQARANEKVRYVFQENQGLGAARNHGIRASRAPYLLFLDADDALASDALLRFRSGLQNGTPRDFLWGGSTRVEIDGRIEETPYFGLSGNKADNFRTYLRKGQGMIYPGTMLIRRAVFDRIRWPVSTYIWEDAVFYSHLFALYEGSAFPESVVTIYKHGDSLQHNIELIRRDGLKTVDLLFDPKVLPAGLMAMRQEYLALTLMKMIKIFFERGYYRDAMRFSHQGFRSCPRYLLRLKHLRRYRRIIQNLIWQKILAAVSPASLSEQERLKREG